MTTIILLSALADADRVTPIIDALVEDRLDARWVPVGSAADVAEAHDAIAAARCVLVAWSVHTLTPESAPFQALARAAIDGRKAVGVLVDRVAPPVGAGGTTLYDLSGWRGRPAFWRRWLGGGLYMRDVTTAARYKVAGRDPAPPSAPRAMLVRQSLATIPAVFALIALVPTLYGFWRDLDLAGADETAAWRGVDPADCGALRTFLTRFPDGKLAAQAQARLDGRTVVTQTRWRTQMRRMPLYVGDGLAPAAPSRANADAVLNRRIDDDARTVCRGLAEAGQARFVRSILLPGTRSCQSATDGVRCSFDGAVSCTVQEPVPIEVERCGIASDR